MLARSVSIGVWAMTLAAALLSCEATSGDACTTNADCKEAEHCDVVFNACQPDASEGELCSSDEECSMPLRCLGSHCRTGSPGSECVYASDCLPGLHCPANECTTGEEQEPCEYDGDCEAPLVCDADLGRLGKCHPPADLGQPCAFDNDCANTDRGVVCVAAYNPPICAKRGSLESPCAENADCNDGLVCAGPQIGLLTCTPEPKP